MSIKIYREIRPYNQTNSQRNTKLKDLQETVFALNQKWVICPNCTNLNARLIWSHPCVSPIREKTEKIGPTFSYWLFSILIRVEFDHAFLEVPFSCNVSVICAHEAPENYVLYTWENEASKILTAFCNRK